MKTIATWFYWEPNLLTNAINAYACCPDYNERNYPFIIYKDIGLEYGLEFVDLNKIDINNADAVLVLDYQDRLGKINIPKFGIFTEPITVLPQWYNNDLSISNLILDNYDYAFILDHALCDYVKTFPFTLAIKVYSDMLNNTLHDRHKLCCLISHGGKYSDHPFDLYKERQYLANWFAQNYPNDLDIYGEAWNNPLSKGFVHDSKRNIISKYKFDICFENTHSMPGCISERLGDCFNAGTIPIYWGAPDINNYVPNECYIDKQQFQNNQELYDYLISIPDNVYYEYLNNIRLFMKNPNNPFKAENSARQTIIQIAKILK